MISLKRTIDQIEYHARRFQAVADAWASTIAGMEQHLVTNKNEEDVRRRRRLASLRERLVGEPEPEVLLDVAGEVNAELERYHEAVSESDDRGSDVRDLLAIVTKMIADLTAQSGQRNDRLQKLAKQLERTSSLKTIPELRSHLLVQAGELKSCISDMQKGSQEAIAQLQGELATIKKKLATAEDMASIDALTGVANRREGERLLQKRAHAGHMFSVLLFDLDRFKAINDRYGHAWGDRVLIGFAKRLSEQVRAGEKVFRWGGDEFMVIVDCGCEEALRRAAGIAEKAQGTYDIGFNGQALKLSVRTSYGVAEYHPSETGEQLFARVDASMYQQKHGGHRPAKADIA